MSLYNLENKGILVIKNKTKKTYLVGQDMFGLASKRAGERRVIQSTFSEAYVHGAVSLDIHTLRTC